MTEPLTAHALNILLVDDDEVDVITVQRAFASNRITNNLYVARDGFAALDMLRGTVLPAERRVMLLDLNMPRMTGIELLQQIRDDPALRALTVVVMTTSNEERDRVDAFRLGVAGYIVKPVTFNSFVEAMATLNRYWTLMEL
ncbi:MAG: response regulator [Deltaproteobacteria bacterium]|nr:response regulator [Deltaproteobacteria bacterium]